MNYLSTTRILPQRGRDWIALGLGFGLWASLCVAGSTVSESDSLRTVILTALEVGSVTAFAVAASIWFGAFLTRKRHNTSVLLWASAGLMFGPFVLFLALMGSTMFGK